MRTRPGALACRARGARVLRDPAAGGWRLAAAALCGPCRPL